MKIYTLSGYSMDVPVYECERETPKLYKCKGRWGGYKNIRKSEAFLTWKEAHAALEDQARTNLELQKRRLDMERSKLERVRAMKEPS